MFECYNDAGLSPPSIKFDDFHYFTDFYKAGRHSFVTGPIFIKREYINTVEYVVENRCRFHEPKFSKLTDLRDGLGENLSCIPETAELIGLETDNEVHSEDVGTHTLKVVENLQKLPEFEEMNDTDRLITEIAAYLHDIGKGPKSRWENNKGRQKPDADHPIKALPMLEKILTEYVGRIKKRSARMICMLVCYHDLLGDIIGKGRKIEELFEIVNDERELNMLIAIGKADIMAVRSSWIDEYKIEKIRSTVLEHLEESSE